MLSGPSLLIINALEKRWDDLFCHQKTEGTENACKHEKQENNNEPLEWCHAKKSSRSWRGFVFRLNTCLYCPFFIILILCISEIV